MQAKLRKQLAGQEATLAAAHEDAIITYASPTSFERGADGAVETVVLSTGQRLATRSVAIAAGTGTRTRAPWEGPRTLFCPLL